jgi:transposase
MPWKKVVVGEQRMQFVIRATSGSEGMAALCRALWVSRPTGYLWRRRNQQAGSLTGLAERSRRPQHSPRQTGGEKEQRVVALCQQTGWGAKKLQILLREEEQIALPVRTIHRVLERRGLIPDGVHSPAPTRFERSAPNQL